MDNKFEMLHTPHNLLIPGFNTVLLTLQHNILTTLMASLIALLALDEQFPGSYKAPKSSFCALTLIAQTQQHQETH